MQGTTGQMSTALAQKQRDVARGVPSRVTPGPPALGQQMRGLPAPLFVSDMLTSPAEFSLPPAGSERAPGCYPGIHEPSNYIHLLPGIIPGTEPPTSGLSLLLPVPSEELANSKTIGPRKHRWKRPQKKKRAVPPPQCSVHGARSGSLPCRP